MGTLKVLNFLVLILFLSNKVHADWTIDLSRRQKDLTRAEFEPLKDFPRPERKMVLDMATDHGKAIQDLVIINTKKGFKPAMVQIKAHQTYRIHVVNVNKDHKNLSFMLDDFSEHHGTYFGEEVSFTIEPRREGLFSFRCPETMAKGQFVVQGSGPFPLPPAPNISLRQPASRR